MLFQKIIAELFMKELNCELQIDYDTRTTLPLFTAVELKEACAIRKLKSFT